MLNCAGHIVLQDQGWKPETQSVCAHEEAECLSCDLSQLMSLC